MAQRQQWWKISGAGDAIERAKIIQQDSLEEQSSLSCGIMECLSRNEKESLEKWHGSQPVNSQELGIWPATLWVFYFFIPCNFSNHKSSFTPWIHRCTSGNYKLNVMCGGEGWFGSLSCHGHPATIIVCCFFFFYVDWQLKIADILKHTSKVFLGKAGHSEATLAKSWNAQTSVFMNRNVVKATLQHNETEKNPPKTFIQDHQCN